MASSGGGGGGGEGVGCHFSPSGSKSPMLIAILFHEVIINKCICDRFYSVHCIQFSQLNEYTSSEVALKSEVRAHHASAYLSIDTRQSPSMTRSRQLCHHPSHSTYHAN